MTGVEIATIMAVASVAQGVSEYQTGQANAKISKQNAMQASLNATENERRQRMKSYISQGSSRAIAGASGLDAADLLESNAMSDELDALTIRHSGLVESINYRNQAKIQKAQATNGLIKGFIGAGTSLMAGGAGAFPSATDKANRAIVYGGIPTGSYGGI